MSTGILVIVPVALIDAAREMTALRYMDESQRDHYGVPLSADGAEPATHYASNWQSGSDEFIAALQAGVLADPSEYPEWLDVDLIGTAYANYTVWEPYADPPTSFDPALINVVVTQTGKGAEFRTLAAAAGLQQVQTEAA